MGSPGSTSRPRKTWMPFWRRRAAVFFRQRLVPGAQVDRAAFGVVGVGGQQVHKVPVQVLVQQFGRVAAADQPGGVDLGQRARRHPAVEQRRVLGYIGVALDMRQDRGVALLLHGVQRILDAAGVEGRGQLDQQVARARKAQLAQIQRGQHRGVVDLRARLGGQRQALAAHGLGGLAQRRSALGGKLFQRGAFIVKVRREHQPGCAVGQLLAQQRQRHADILRAVVNAGQQVAVQIDEILFHSPSSLPSSSSPSCL